MSKLSLSHFSREARGRFPLRAADRCRSVLPAAALYETVLRFEEYRFWWPRRFALEASVRAPDERVGSTVEFSPAPNMRAGWRIVACAPAQWIQIEYHCGPHEGTGLWTFAEERGGTEFGYQISVLPKTTLLHLMYVAAGVMQKHTRDMELLFERLERRACVHVHALCDHAVARA